MNGAQWRSSSLFLSLPGSMWVQTRVRDPFCCSEARDMADVSLPVQRQCCFCSLTNTMGRQRSLKLFWRLCNDAWEPTCFCLSAFFPHISQDATGREIQPNPTALVIGLESFVCPGGEVGASQISNLISFALVSHLETDCCWSTPPPEKQALGFFWR